MLSAAQVYRIELSLAQLSIGQAVDKDPHTDECLLRPTDGQVFVDFIGRGAVRRVKVAVEEEREFLFA